MVESAAEAKVQLSIPSSKWGFC